MKPNRSVVLAASKNLFTKHGFKKVTMGDVAEACQISRPTLYALFPDKFSLFGACVSSVVENYADEARLILTAEMKIQDKLRAVFKVYVGVPFEEFSGSAEKFDILRNAEVYAPEEMRGYWRAFENQLCEALGGTHNKSAANIAKVLVCFGRDARISAQSSDELALLIETAIALAT